MDVDSAEASSTRQIDRALRSLEGEVDRTLRNMRTLLQRTHGNYRGDDMPIAAKIAAWTGLSLGAASFAGASFLLLQNQQLNDQNAIMMSRLDLLCSGVQLPCIDPVTADPSLSLELAAAKGRKLLALDDGSEAHVGPAAIDFASAASDTETLSDSDRTLAVAYRDLRIFAVSDPTLAALMLNAALEFGRARALELFQAGGLNWPPTAHADVVRANDPISVEAALSALRLSFAREGVDDAARRRLSNLEQRLKPASSRSTSSESVPAASPPQADKDGQDTPTPSPSETQ